MPAVTGNELIKPAYELVNMFIAGEPIPAADGASALGMLNRMLSQWRQRRMMIPLAQRELFDLTVFDGGPYDPYTIGPGGDLDTDPRPPNQNSILAANLVLTSPGPPNEVRVPLGIYTTDAYFANQIPGMQSGQPTSLFYNPTYDHDLGAVFLWPVPNVATNDLELLLLKPIAKFANLTTTYYLPDGADDAIVYQLAMRLAGPNGRTLNPEDKQIGIASLAAFKRSNVQLSDLMNDAAGLFSASRPVYNIQTGSGG